MANEPSKTYAEMLSEALREIGYLYLIFGILDAQMLTMEWTSRGEKSVFRPAPVKVEWYFLVIAASLLIWYVGARIERER